MTHIDFVNVNTRTMEKNIVLAGLDALIQMFILVAVLILGAAFLTLLG